MRPSRRAVTPGRRRLRRTPDTITLNTTAGVVAVATVVAIAIVGYAMSTAVRQLSTTTITQDIVRLAH